jgi:two-component system chemotaxis response regulator CheY
MRFLIVEDDLLSQKLLKKMLEKYAECVVASNGQEGYDLFCEAADAKMPFDLITLDVMMPQASGTECLSSIRAYESETLQIPEESRVKVIMTTAVDDALTVYDAHASGCTQYLVKPIERKRLIMTLERLGLIAQGGPSSTNR